MLPYESGSRHGGHDERRTAMTAATQEQSKKKDKEFEVVINGTEIRSTTTW